jgi:hypothetical protein
MYFEINTGLRITNTISYGPNDELLLTYTFFTWTGMWNLHTTDSCNHPPRSLLAPGAAPDEPKPSAKELNEIVGRALHRGLDIIREMVKEGKL